MPAVAGGFRWRYGGCRRTPTARPRFDDLVVIDLAPVPGAVTGASVDLPWLDRLGKTSGPKWRAYIAARSLIWLPGKTRRPVPGSNGPAVRMEPSAGGLSSCDP